MTVNIGMVLQIMWQMLENVILEGKTGESMWKDLGLSDSVEH
jgi:hypothetical protein